MFEYLMPQLVMPSYDGTLLDQTCRAAVARQIAYGRQRSLPWGISESGYNVVDANLNYQYHAFGVPGLGLTRGLADDLVIAPYASALALLVAPEEACANLQKLAALGMEGPFGFYEAVDYTPARLPRGQASAIVRSFMSHHQGMNLLSLVARASRPADAGSLRIRPRVPGDAACCCRSGSRRPSAFHTHVAQHAEGSAFAERARCLDPRPHRRRTRRRPKSSCCRTAGSTSWSPMPGADIAAGRISPSPAGARTPPATTGVHSSICGTSPAGSTGRPRTSRRSGGRTATRRCSPRDAPNTAAATSTTRPTRRSSFRRRTTSSCAGCASPTIADVRRTIEVTSYAEVVLAPPAADALQPSFGNLFVQTEIVPARRTILCTRRPRSATRADAVDVPPARRPRRRRRQAVL